ncbi:HSP20-like chaperone, putative [Plasmodium gallinaceum]|uniref:HSP20-like chaperone, putative n=1 Tax=Plasmodium gallinaceum TaxID=5849 RepID=A0A1J1GY13_PLAGA|nr:HSP20-like chaperone, putative [Plasmodium gallinaceum]CRG95896.1 HSP20-like chaperone, putative [Plasmodium gallinaceum]
MVLLNATKPKIIIESSGIPIMQESIPGILSSPVEKTVYSSYAYNVPVSQPKVISHNEYKYNSTKYTTKSHNMQKPEFINTFEPHNGFYYEGIPLKTNTNNIFEITPSQEELNKITYNPRIEIYSTSAFAVVMMDIPGTSKENLNVELEKGLLKIYGRKNKPKIEELEKENEYHTKIIERLNEYYFCKIFQMPPAFSEGQSISCKLNDGELVIKILANELKTQKKVIDIQS